MHRAEHHCVRLFLSPDLQAALQRAQQLIGILPRTLRLMLQQFAARPPRLFVKPRLQFFGDEAKGSGRRWPRFCFGLACAAGRISPSFQAVLRLDRNQSRETDRPPQPMACRTCRRCRRGAAAPSASRSAPDRVQPRTCLRECGANRFRRPRIRQQSLAGRRRAMITLVHAGAVPLLCGQLEGGLEEVHEQPNRRIELRQGCGGFKPSSPAIADDAA